MQQKRELGRSGIKITPLMLGGNVFGFAAEEEAWSSAKSWWARCRWR
jgi:aryl-alcohol dehydrogenase-like predicted oxidoreductase